MSNWISFSLIKPIIEIVLGVIGAAIFGIILFGFASAALEVLTPLLAGLASMSAKTWIIVLLVLILFKK